jgi:hypothetical protein
MAAGTSAEDNGLRAHPLLVQKPVPEQGAHGLDVIVQIMLGMVAPDVIDAMWKRQIERGGGQSAAHVLVCKSASST